VAWCGGGSRAFSIVGGNGGANIGHGGEETKPRRARSELDALPLQGSFSDFKCHVSRRHVSSLRSISSNSVLSKKHILSRSVQFERSSLQGGSRKQPLLGANEISSTPFLQVVQNAVID
jgi:hypothetical protein